MAEFRLLTKTRQITEYSCGASALQAVLSYWGIDIDETELMNRLGTTSEFGTFPEEIGRVARSLGLQAEVRDNLSLDELARFTADGHPVVALAQVWRSEKSSAANPEEDWDSGHYIAVLGVDDRYVYFQDPYLRMGKVFVPRDLFERHWHQVMGGEATQNPKLMHVGILIRGERPAPSGVARELSLSTLDFGRFGSMNLIVTRFAGLLLPFDFMDELRDIWGSSAVRPDAFVLVRKDADGNVSAMQGGNLGEQEDAVEVNALIAALTSRSIGDPASARSGAEAAAQAALAGDFGLSSGNIHEIAGSLPPDHSVMIVLFENLWERRFREVVGRYGGEVVNQRFASRETMIKAARELSQTSE
jgi:uncharacterized protein